MKVATITSAWRRAPGIAPVPGSVPTTPGLRLPHRASALLKPLLPLALVATASAQSVVLNEFSYDDTGTDDREFVEIFNASGVPVNIGGWQVRFDTGVTSGTLATIPGATVLQPGAYWLIAQPFWTARNQLLAANLPNTTAAIVLSDAGTITIDSVVYEGYAGLWPTAPVEGDPLFPEFLSTDGFDTSWSRTTDGHDTNRNTRDFRIARATPGATNNRLPLAPYSENADGLAPGTSVPGWFGFQGAPTVVSASATAIAAGQFLPPSPQSPAANDRCMAFQPGANNDRSYWIEAEDSASAAFDAYVWIDAQALPAGARHAWSIGIRGGTGSLYAWPGLPTPSPTDNNGDRGVTWTYQSTSSSHTLYLVDHGDGGRALSVLQTLPITASGWHRLTLGADGPEVEARFGGTVGTTSGTLYRHNVQLGEGDIYVGTRNEGAATLSLFVDVGLGKIAYKTQAQNGGSGCQGNCPVINTGVKNLNLKIGSKAPPGTYALHVNASGSVGCIITDACVFTRQRPNTTANESIWIYTDVGSSGNPTPGNPVTLAFLQDHSGKPENSSWWAGPANSFHYAAAASFFVVIQLNGNLEAPLANSEIGQNLTPWWIPDQASYWMRDTNGTWHLQTGTLPWTLALVCADKAGDLKSAFKTDATPGGILGFDITGAGSLQPIIGFANTLSMSLDLGIIGAPGCTLLVDPNGALTFLAFADALGMASWQIPLPNNPAFLGVQGHFQFFSPDPSLNALGLASTDRLTITIQ